MRQKTQLQPTPNNFNNSGSSFSISSNEDNNIKNAVEGVIDPDTLRNEAEEDIIPSSNEDDNDSDESNGCPSKEQQSGKITIGGIIKEEAYAVLAGIKDDDEVIRKIEMPLVRLPSILGRANKGMEGKSNFISLGDVKAISRDHCSIYYRDLDGGRVGEYSNVLTDDETKLVYEESKHFPRQEVTEILYDLEKERVSEKGFFVIECKSKNSIYVNGKKVERNKSALLRHKSAIGIGPYKLYFLLPEQEDEQNVQTRKEVDTREHYTEHNVAKRAKVSHAHHNIAKASTTTTEIKSKPLSSTTPTPSKTSYKKVQERQEALIQLESLPTTVLMTRFYSAIHAVQWERKHQLIGSALCFHAVRDAARSKYMKALASKDNGRVSRSDVMNWISTSRKYREWVNLMLTKMELKSYQGNVGKALTRGGYERSGTTGRQVRWELPKDLIDEVYSDEEGEEERIRDAAVSKIQVPKEIVSTNSQNITTTAEVKDDNKATDTSKMPEPKEKIININQNIDTIDDDDDDIVNLLEDMDQQAIQQQHRIVNPPPSQQREVITIDDDL